MLSGQERLSVGLTMDFVLARAGQECDLTGAEAAVTQRSLDPQISRGTRRGLEADMPRGVWGARRVTVAVHADAHGPSPPTALCRRRRSRRTGRRQVDEATLAAAAGEYLGRFLSPGRRCTAVVCGDMRRAAEVADGLRTVLGVPARAVRLRELVPQPK